jgi:hypothetical protein
VAIADKLFHLGGMSPALILDMPAEFIVEAVGISQEAAESILAKAAVADGRVPVENPAAVSVAEPEAETNTESADAS